MNCCRMRCAGRRGRGASGTRCSRGRSWGPHSTWPRPTSGPSAELVRISAEIVRRGRADRRPGASVAEVIATLDADPARKLHGTAALAAWMQGKSDEAIESLGRSHFDIPAPIRATRVPDRADDPRRHLLHRPERGLQPPGPHVVVGTRGGDRVRDLERADDVYHEGVPGHHLQIAQTVYRRELLNRWRRLGAWSSGHGEGLGAVRRAADGRPRLPRRSGRPARDAAVAGVAGGARA